MTEEYESLLIKCERFRAALATIAAYRIDDPGNTVEYSTNKGDIFDIIYDGMDQGEYEARELCAGLASRILEANP